MLLPKKFLFIFTIFLQIFINIYFCIGILWEKEATDTYCANSNKLTDVSNQNQCQEKCEAISTCPGISYSYKAGSTTYCYVCLNDVLSSAVNDFGFYRKPGMFKLKFHRGVNILLKNTTGQF